MIAAHAWRSAPSEESVSVVALSTSRSAPPALSPTPAQAPNAIVHVAAPVIAARTISSKAALNPYDDKTIVVVAPPHASNVEGFNLDITSSSSLWVKAGARYRIDPVLIYAVALVETRGVQPDGSVAPSPWIVRINGHLHNGTRAESEHAIELAHLLAVPVQDVGIMQVYYPMHRDIEPDPIALLNPARNIDIGTSLLRKAMKESDDPVLRIGYYHSHDAELARGYGQTVLNVYHELKTVMGKSPASAVALEHAPSDAFAMHGGG
ncbi:transglycosylase SLT domain-containing protein [Dyella lipolytica]|uniref:Transglycosylase SLT domain-containing protein n=1 Tax=Dyella lipolytica TaxID=1867835 RepID=A0ABW8ISC8_9GAMM|nr:transglycosylase SLT domain-containing protein [Dyella lipolytica]